MIESTLSDFYKELKDIFTYRGVQALLDWDQKVGMPKGGAQSRATQLEAMTALLHERVTSKKLQSLIETLMGNLTKLSPDDQVNVKETHRNLERERKLPPDFVAERARVSAEAYTVWVESRPTSDFARVKPFLGKLIELSRKEADLVGYKDHPYDALLDAYESYATLKSIKPMFQTLGEELAKRIPQLSEKSKSTKELNGNFPVAAQQALGIKVASDLGLNFEESRLDTTHHPFMTTIGVGDIRITTRYDVKNFLPSLYGTIHETGHALYEQGFNREQYGTPCGAPVSLGVHESQSRFFENIIGRSLSFQKYLSRIMPEFFGAEAKDLTPERMFSLVNRIRPSLIRVEADEVTYSLHIVIRLLLEEELIAGTLTVDKLPEAWDDAYEKYLGVRSPALKDGVMQDIHWYSGMFGYFPTYALGNLYGACLYQVLRKDIPELDSQIERGEFAPTLEWMKTRIHRQGSRFPALQLIQNVTGKPVSAEPFIAYLDKKLS